MDKEQLQQLTKELKDIKNLLVLLLRQNEAKEENIANALGITQGRLSQILPLKLKKNKKDCK